MLIHFKKSITIVYFIISVIIDYFTTSVIVFYFIIQFNSIYFTDYQEDRHTKTVNLQDIHAQKVLIHEYIHLFIHITARHLRNLEKSIFRNFLVNK